MTWAELLATISYRLNRTDLPDAFVREMASERVDFYGPQVLQPAEMQNYSIVLQPGQNTYTLPRGTQNLAFVRVLYNGTWIPCPRANRFSDILQSDPVQPAFTSLPVTLYAILGNQLRFFPTPNQEYPIELTGMFTITEPTDDNDNTNFWVVDGRMLLINATMLSICAERLDIAVPNSPRIAQLTRNVELALNELQTQSGQIGGPWLIRQYL